MILDGALIRRRREELGLSLRAVGNHIGVAAAVVVRIEAGDNHPDLSLATLVRLAQRLAVDPRLLFLDAADTRDSEPSDAAAKVGALLHAAGVVTPVAAIADSLRWPKDRVETALASLASQLTTVGLRLNRIPAGVSIVRDVAACGTDELAALIRRHLARDGINLTEAAMLERLRRHGPPKEPTNPQAVAIGVLRNAGLIEPGSPAKTGSQPPLVLSEEVRFSLLLDEEPDDPLLGATT